MNDGLSWWLRRDESEYASTAHEASWNSWKAPHREHISATLELLMPFTSLYEVGTQAGPNLRRIHADHPSLKLGGCEPCAGARAFAQAMLGIELEPARIEDMRTISSVPEWDVLLSCYALAYVEPDMIWSAVHKMTRMARKGIVLLEPTAWGQWQKGKCRNDHLQEWRHDLRAELDANDWDVAWAWPIEPVQNANAIMVAVPYA